MKYHLEGYLSRHWITRDDLRNLKAPPAEPIRRARLVVVVVSLESSGPEDHGPHIREDLQISMESMNELMFYHRLH